MGVAGPSITVTTWKRELHVLRSTARVLPRKFLPFYDLYSEPPVSSLISTFVLDAYCPFTLIITVYVLFLEQTDHGKTPTKTTPGQTSKAPWAGSLNWQIGEGATRARRARLQARLVQCKVWHSFLRMVTGTTHDDGYCW